MQHKMELGEAMALFVLLVRCIETRHNMGDTTTHLYDTQKYQYRVRLRRPLALFLSVARSQQGMKD